MFSNREIKIAQSSLKRREVAALSERLGFFFIIFEQRTAKPSAFFLLSLLLAIESFCLRNQIAVRHYFISVTHEDSCWRAGAVVLLFCAKGVGAVW